ncbi:hypothetical protein ACU8MP_35095 (plasmid) [Rhizobium leguminosarum]|uniref:hypothetical protein n=1 Tax=Rhizobium leguminosarum TaxID=384 RepID=UPI0017F089C7|nr:hypothetical protein [Rhizobium leguminosarum]MBA9034731.1 hypothetical protein [Rhizobium leguminosarum]
MVLEKPEQSFKSGQNHRNNGFHLAGIDFHNLKLLTKNKLRGGQYMLRKISILGTLILASCTSQGSNMTLASMMSGYRGAPTSAETVAWRNAQRSNTDQAYRNFISQYPNSSYVPVATSRITRSVNPKPVAVRNFGGSDRSSSFGRSGSAY